jgi:hypothetical protein
MLSDFDKKCLKMEKLQDEEENNNAVFCKFCGMSGWLGDICGSCYKSRITGLETGLEFDN